MNLLLLYQQMGTPLELDRRTKDISSQLIIDVRRPNNLQNSFFHLIVDQLELQGQEPAQGKGGHPDPIIRSFYRSAHTYINDDLFFSIFGDIHQKRPGMDETHFVNLLFRAVQYSCRKNGNTDYVSYKDNDWNKYFETDCPKNMSLIRETMLQENTATQVLERYRSLNTAIRLTRAENIGDIGCSLGLGLKACLSQNYLNNPTFVDNTPGQQIAKSFNTPITPCHVVGIDIRIPTLDWVKACNYPSKYTQDGESLDNAIASLSSVDIQLIETSVLSPNLPGVIQSGGPALDIIHASMSMYELSLADQKTALRNISRALKLGGIFIEFTFKDPKNWFAGINTLVRVNTNSGLSSPLVWHEWDNSRCTRVWAGKDFEEVNSILC